MKGLDYHFLLFFLVVLFEFDFLPLLEDTSYEISLDNIFLTFCDNLFEEVLNQLLFQLSLSHLYSLSRVVHFLLEILFVIVEFETYRGVVWKHRFRFRQ